ncbi:MAG: Bro-N domain-containing protein [Methanobacteriaceae archaeon]|nr:Bro-N domain-containing protein [Methanobacteriaceae archaeon]
MSKNAIKLFEDRKIRTLWDDDEEEWYFSVIDVIGVLTESKNPRRYWSDLKNKMKSEEGNEMYENIVQLKMPSPDGKMRLTDVASTKQLLRLIQSIPSPNAEPFKIWLAEVGKERLDEIADPELAMERAINTYKVKGYTDAWINQRLKSIEMRKELTDEWKRSGIEGIEYAILTDEIIKAWADMDTKEYKKLKGLKKENLRDNMSNLELVLTMLAEASTTEISKNVSPEGFDESKDIAQRGGNVAGEARKNIEKQSGKPVITSRNARSPKLLDDN